MEEIVGVFLEMLFEFLFEVVVELLAAIGMHRRKDHKDRKHRQSRLSLEPCRCPA